MTITYILNEHGEPVPCDDSVAWARWFESANRQVARDELPGACVSTVFLGIATPLGDGIALWETMIFGGALDGEGRRYATREAALVGHALMVLVAKGETTIEAVEEMEKGLS